ncbi:MAG: serine hydrolase [Afipia sp.]|nr:serine hydrolase [Afipia sp.]
MLAVKPAPSRALRLCLLSAIVVSATFLFATDSADARRYRRHHAVATSSYSPAFASIIVDANSGKTLQATSADSPRHPASLTKIMTLYLLFERLESGKLKLDSTMDVSENASEQAPTKLGLQPGQTLRVEDAIKGLVTRSANDAAVVIAEAIGGSEEAFAKEMTRKARALGMSKTTYKNSSGLPDDDQITTARDQATLGRAIQDRFPKYYRYFATDAFNYRGRVIRNHNRLIGRVEGVDGIKTGYTRASGFNLVTSMKRGNRFMVGVVLGGRSGGSRNAIMRNLLAEHLDEASTKRTIATITEKNASDIKVAEAKNDNVDATPRATPMVQVKGAVQTASAVPDPVPPPAPRAPSVPAKDKAEQDTPVPAPMSSGVIAAQAFAAIPGSDIPMTPVRIKTVQVRMGQAKVASAVSVPVATSAIPAPAQPTVAETSKSVVARAETKIEAPPQPEAEVRSAAPRVEFPAPLPTQANTSNGIGQGMIGRVPAPAAANSNAMASIEPVQRGAPPSSLGAQAQVLQTSPASAPAPQPAANQQPTQPVQAVQDNSAIKPVMRSGWIVQVGALESESEARQRLDAAKGSAGRLLGGADPFTETVAKGNKTLYRARFAGLNQDSAEAVCRTLKRSDISCIAIRN